MKLRAILCLMAALPLLAPAHGAEPCHTPDCKPDQARLYGAMDTFAEAIDRIQRMYIDKPNSAALVDKAMAGMVAALDPHSSYLTPAEFAAMSTHTKGEDAGIGLTITKRGEFAKVIAPLDASPAAEAGIKSGDLIAEIDGTALDGVALNRVIDMLHGPLDSTVSLTVLRAGTDTPLNFTLRRRFVHNDDVSQKTIGGIGYIKVSSLTYGTSDRVRAAFAKLKGSVNGLILDLRDDPGGLLDEAVTVADLFLENGEIAATRGRTKQDVQRFAAKPGDIAKGRTLIVLVNEGTAAGAEIIAGALQDNRRAIVVGMPTFGEGTIQTIIPLENGGALRLTTSEVVLPSGRGLQAAGILPDIAVAAAPQNVEGYPLIAYTAAKREAALAGHRPAGTPARAPGKVLYPGADKAAADFQLETALAQFKRK